MAHETRPSRRAGAVVAWLHHRPVVTVLLIGVVFVIFQCWWISHGRFFGALDTDEGAAVAATLRFHRALAGGPREFIGAAFETGNAPLVPALATPFIIVFGRSATAPMFVQPVLVAATAIGVAGAVRQLVGSRPAIVAGCCTLAMPALITSSRTNQYSTGVGAFMCLAIWALLASDGGRRTWRMLAFGAACGAMTISRTMAVSFVPAMGAAALIVVALRDPKARRNSVLAVAAALAVAGPWWWKQWDYVSGYLLSSGYGKMSDFFGQEAIFGRVNDHVAYLMRDFRVMLPLGVFVAVVCGLEAVRLSRTERLRWWSRHRPLLGVWAAIAFGTLALLTSSNRGFWFSTPLDALLVIAVTSSGTLLLRRSHRPAAWSAVAAALCALMVAFWGAGATGIPPWLGLFAGAAMIALTTRVVPGHRAVPRVVLGIAAVTFAASTPLAGPSISFADGSVRTQLVGGLEPYLPTVFQTDARLGTSDIDDRREVAGEWAAAARELDRRLVALETKLSIGESGTLAEVLTGARGLIEDNTVAVARELGPRGVRWMVSPDTFAGSDDELLAELTPTAYDGTPRLVIVLEGRAPPFPNSLEWHRLVRLAEGIGWRIDSTIPLPDRGRIAIYVHPDTSDR